MSRSIRRQSSHARLALGLSGLGCLIALVLLLFLGFYTDASLDADVPVEADAARAIEEPSAPASNTPHVPDPHTSHAQAERALELLASLQNDPTLLISNDPIVLDDDLILSSIDNLHDIAPDELLASCVWCPELLPTGGPEQLFAYGGPMGVPWIVGGGRSSSGGSGAGAGGGGGAVGGGGGSGGGGGTLSPAGEGQQASAASSQNGGSHSSGSTGNEKPGDDRGESNGRSNSQNGNPNTNGGSDSTGNDDRENTLPPPGDGPWGGSYRETPVSNNQPVSVPEPSVLVLTLVGLGSLAGTRRVARRLR